MKRSTSGLLAILTLTLMFATMAFEGYAHARAGGGRSFGSRGTRSYSRPASPARQPSPTQQYAPPPRPYNPAPAPQPAGGGFFRSMAGGIVGGMLGGMLFRSLGFGGMGGGLGGSGIGLFEIILLAGIGYMIYRMVRRRREEAQVYQYGSQGGGFGASSAPQHQDIPAGAAPLEDPLSGLAHIRQMDSSFDEGRFKDSVMDIFFRVQGAWMNRDLTSAASLLTGDMRRTLQGDVDTLIRERRVNRLENIAVRSVELVEAWQESGQDYITTLIYANLLDYTTDDATGAVVAGSRSEPVKFEEFWTFTRAVGNNQWQLSAIEQK
jgi:predicted lipid-binding transport protein (Tim44 family)